MRIYSWNVNGIRAVARKGLFDPFILEQQPDILCLQETKAEQGQTEVNVHGYKEFWNSAEKKGYSGTAIFTKHEPIKVINGLPEEIIKKYKVSGDLYGDPNKEGRVIAAEFEKFYVVSVYTPNAKDDLSRLEMRFKHWDPAFLAYCRQLQEKKPVIACGDFNVAHEEIDLARPKENVGKKGFTDEERAGFDNFLAAGFLDSLRLFKQDEGYYTWWTHWANARARNIGWRIDYIVVSSSLKNKLTDADIHPKILGSDHCPISVDLEV